MKDGTDHPSKPFEKLHCVPLIICHFLQLTSLPTYPSPQLESAGRRLEMAGAREEESTHSVTGDAPFRVLLSHIPAVLPDEEDELALVVELRVRGLGQSRDGDGCEGCGGGRARLDEESRGSRRWHLGFGYVLCVWIGREGKRERRPRVRSAGLYQTRLASPARQLKQREQGSQFSPTIRMMGTSFFSSGHSSSSIPSSTSSASPPSS